jgi:drug/metabolite transporter (DMT)-like permease
MHVRTGALFCLASAAGFGAMGVFGKLAYDAGATVGTLLAVRFVLAAAILWAFVLATGRARAIQRCRAATS